MPQSGLEDHAAGRGSPNDAFFLVTPNLLDAAIAATSNHLFCRTPHQPRPHAPTPPPDNARAAGVATHPPSSPQYFPPPPTSSGLERRDSVGSARSVNARREKGGIEGGREGVSCGEKRKAVASGGEMKGGRSQPQGSLETPTSRDLPGKQLTQKDMELPHAVVAPHLIRSARHSC